MLGVKLLKLRGSECERQAGRASVKQRSTALPTVKAAEIHRDTISKRLHFRLKWHRCSYDRDLGVANYRGFALLLLARSPVEKFYVTSSQGKYFRITWKFNYKKLPSAFIMSKKLQTYLILPPFRVFLANCSLRGVNNGKNGSVACYMKSCFVGRFSSASKQ